MSQQQTTSYANLVARAAWHFDNNSYWYHTHTNPMVGHLESAFRYANAELDFETESARFDCRDGDLRYQWEPDPDGEPGEFCGYIVSHYAEDGHEPVIQAAISGVQLCDLSQDEEYVVMRCEEAALAIEYYEEHPERRS